MMNYNITIIINLNLLSYSWFMYLEYIYCLIYFFDYLCCLYEHYCSNSNFQFLKVSFGNFIEKIVITQYVRIKLNIIIFNFSYV